MVLNGQITLHASCFGSHRGSVCHPYGESMLADGLILGSTGPGPYHLLIMCVEQVSSAASNLCLFLLWASVLLSKTLASSNIPGPLYSHLPFPYAGSCPHRLWAPQAVVLKPHPT